MAYFVAIKDDAVIYIFKMSMIYTHTHTHTSHKRNFLSYISGYQ